jgi:hypothetical protein
MAEYKELFTIVLAVAVAVGWEWQRRKRDRRTRLLRNLRQVLGPSFN